MQGETKRLPLVGASNAFRSTAYGDQTCVNLYGELGEDPQERAKGFGALYGCPGKHVFKSYTSSATARTFGLWSGGGRLFAVNARSAALGTDLIELNSSATEVSRHLIQAGEPSAPAQIFSNGNQLLIICGGKAYCDNGSGPVVCTFDNLNATVDTAGTLVTLVSIGAGSVLSGFASFVGGETVTVNGSSRVVAVSPAPDATTMTLTTSAGTHSGVTFVYTGDQVTATTGAYLDGYFIVQRPRGGSPDLGRQMNFSAVLNGLSWSSLDFFSADAEPSYIASIWADNEQLYAFKDASIQVFQTSDAGFDNLKGAMSKYGTYSAFSVGAINGKLYFLGAPGGFGSSPAGGAQAFVLDGFTPRKISGVAQENGWQQTGFASSAVSYTYEEEGHSFWVLNDGSQCWGFDTTTGAWHQRASWSGSAFGAYTTFFHAFVPEWGTGGKHITAGDPAGSGTIYESSVNFYDDAGADLGWQRTIPYIYQGGNLAYYGRMYLECETGTVASGDAPTITRTYSDDRGASFVGAETASLGTHGQADTRVIWPQAPFSNSPGRIFRFAGAGQYKVALIDLQADISYGST